MQWGDVGLSAETIPAGRRALEPGAPSVTPPDVRPSVRGKFLFAGDEKLYVRGVTYGTFASSADGHPFPDPAVVRTDFQHMTANGINAVRTYSCPPRWLMDEAHLAGLRVLAGLDWEDHMAFLDDKRREAAVLERVQAAAETCAGHPALLAYAIGNEIPGQIVRWQSARKVEAFLSRLIARVRAVDPAALVTYANYPTTEYLSVRDVDFVSFNLYLEREADFRSYLPKLQNLAGDKPLLITELGFDSRHHTPDEQAEVLSWQIDACFQGGCAGAFVFAWTDQWFRGGDEIVDWDFGLTTRERQPKPALSAVRRAYSSVPFDAGLDWPFVSIVVCSYNGSRTIVDTLSAIARLDYPCYETIVVNDGSTDSTPDIATVYGARLISTENRGLSSARNTGAAMANGEIVAYIDDDAYPDPHWLRYLAWSFMSTSYAGIGGPNLPPPGDGFAAECVSNSPGGPIHVLLTDELAEHIPGCNMAFRKQALDAIDGFDPRFRTAGDDIDFCWRLMDAGNTIGFNHAAVVWHHRRSSLRAFWRQQVGYGRAEALLESKWPERYNATGHLAWAGRLYGNGLTRRLGMVQRVYHGPSGSAPFQPMYATGSSLWSLPQMPEWYLLLGVLAGLTAVGAFWAPLLLAAGSALALCTLLLVWQTWTSVSNLPNLRDPSLLRRLYLWTVTFFLHLMQPLARLRGRMRHGLTLWRRRGRMGFAAPLPTSMAIWTGEWAAPAHHQSRVRNHLGRSGAVVLPAGPFDTWDIEIRGGLLASYRLIQAVEEHGNGVQRLLYRGWPRFSRLALVAVGMLFALSAASALDQAPVAAVLLAAATSLVALYGLFEASAATYQARIGLNAVSQEISESKV